MTTLLRLRQLPAILLGGGLCLSAGCGRTESPTPAAPLTLPAPLVDADWLATHRDHPDLVVIDARDRDRYDAGHIAGAINLSPDELTDPDQPHAVAPVRRIQQVIGGKGVDVQRTVVIYDDSNYREAARVFWVLEMHGHPACAVLDGGLSAWTGRRQPTTTEPTTLAPRQMIANVQPQRLATKLTVRRAIDSGDTLLLDSRSPSEYAGLQSKTARRGHIPGAINVDFERNLLRQENGACAFRALSELTAMYREELPADHGPIVTYCNTGNRASVSYLALRTLGYDAAVYNGSWTEWSSDEAMPVETTAAAPRKAQP